MIINNVDALVKLAKDLKKNKKKIGLCHGVYDVLHSGHLLHFEEAKQICDILIVSITSDEYVNKGINRPYLNENTRLKIINSIKTVDYTFCNFDLTPIKIIKLIKPNFYIKGIDYTSKKNDLTDNLSKEIKAIKSVNGKFYITKSIKFSSSKIINENFNILDEEFDFLKKKISTDNIIKHLNFLKNKIKKKVLVIGEPIIDQYTSVKILGKSAKNNIISTKFSKIEKYGGGSLLVANLLSKFIERVDYVTFNKINNSKDYNEFLEKKIKRIFIENSSKIIKKNRFIDLYSGQKLFQINYDNDYKWENSKEIKKFVVKMKKITKQYDNIIVLDYGHGFFEKNIVNLINKFHNKTSINCQVNSSNLGFNIVKKYNKAKIISIDEAEFRLAFNNNTDSIEHLIKKNINYFSRYKNYVITMGKSGSYIIEKKKTFYCPSIVKKTIDTTGCGDVFYSMIIITSFLKNLNNYEKSLIAHVAAGQHSLTLGNNCTITPGYLFNAFNYLMK
jgi:rfaE bifunctional protein nucleotidyltransferase chain/domain